MIMNYIILIVHCRDVDLRKQAVYCYGKALKVNPDDEDALWDRSVVYLELNDIPKVVTTNSRIVVYV